MPNTSLGQDGKWRWMMFDTDWSFGYGATNSVVGSQNSLALATQAGNKNWPNPDYSTLFLRNLLQNQEFKLDFINRFADLLNTRFKPEWIISKIDFFQNRIASEIPEFWNRYDNGNYQQWLYRVNELRTFATSRLDYQYQHLREFFNISQNIQLTVNTPDTTRGKIQLNSILIDPQTPGISENPYPWSGRYFANIPVKIIAKPNPGYVFSHWIINNQTFTENPLILTTDSSSEINAFFVRKDGFYCFFPLISGR